MSPARSNRRPFRKDEGVCPLLILLLVPMMLTVGWAAFVQIVVSRSKRAVPYPILGENTLVLSESACLTEENGELALMFR